MAERIIVKNEPRDLIMFLRSWLSEPLRVGAIAPSGAALAAIITRDVSPWTGPVIELGPGTGVFTAKLLDRGVPAERLTLIEYGPEFVERLQKRFPDIRIINMDAADLGQLPRADGPAGAVISGLPLLSMPRDKVMSILNGAFAHLRLGGAFYTFTYSWRCPVPRPILDQLGLRATMTGKTLLNIPPARVYRISRLGKPVPKPEICLTTAHGNPDNDEGL
ncbi:hypothetical protein ASE04_18370 [Rhizobium sp. Root708]|uniref:class I SAM-dependent methyltransferase n=1 Tax=Rhizobium sp. Root708 TaxID=1736592 RepID=UPI0006FE0F92|nr:methyltransferase domain-containing protein [Rhizobium sp. Root708]KRB49147.1 hypothetical protein ASE04_18370 [Rhizobium sp. Root708]